MKKSMYIYCGLAALSSLLWFACDPTPPPEEPQAVPATDTPTPTPTPTSSPSDPDDGEEVVMENWSPWYMPNIFIQMFGAPACSLTPPEGLEAPGLIGLSARGSYGSICLYGLDLNTPFRIRLYSPDSTQMGDGTFAARLVEGEWTVEQTSPAQITNEMAGFVSGEGQAKRIQIPLYLPAGMPPGEWRLVVEAGGSSREGTLILGEERFPSISSLPVSEINLFKYTYKMTFSPEENSWFLMSNFESRQDQMIDVYFSPDTLEVDLSLHSLRFKRVKSIEVSMDEDGFYGGQSLANLAGPGTYILHVRGVVEEEGPPTLSCLLPWIACYQVQTEDIRTFEEPCQGTEAGGFCWYQGEESASCEVVCRPHGGVNKATLTYAGSEGSLKNCKALLGQMGLTVDEFYETTQGGIGCFTIRSTSGNFLGYWDQKPTTPEATYPGRQRICACQE